MTKVITLASPIKMAQTGGDTVTTDNLQIGQVAIYDDGSGRLGIKGRIGRSAVLEISRPSIPIVLITGPEYIAAPKGMINPDTDRMVFFTMGCRSRSSATPSGHMTKKRYSRMGATTAVAGGPTLWQSKEQTNNAVEAQLSLNSTTPNNATMDFFNVNLSSFESELYRKFYMAGNSEILMFRLGRRRKAVMYYGDEISTGRVLVRLTIGVGIERNKTLLTDIYPVNVLFTVANQMDLSTPEKFFNEWLTHIVLKQLNICYSPRRINGVKWQQPVAK